jgi:hypothetical protein
VSTRPPSPGIRAENLLGVMIARSTPWAAAAGAVCVVAYLVIDGLETALAALLGVGFVALFFGIDLVVLRLTRGSPGAVIAASLLSEYLVKVVLLAAALWALSESTDLDLHASAVTVVVTTVAGAIAVIVVAIRIRSYYFDFPTGSPSKDPEKPGNPGDSHASPET